VGYLSAQSYTPGRFGDADLRLLQTLGDVCGGVLERLRMEERLRASDAQLRQAQKMEAVGRIAGGIAHDFNNLLTVVIGCGELLRAELQGGPLAGHVHEILRSAQRAAGLTRQLLAYSRRQVLQPKVIDLNTIVGDMQAILRRVLEENLRIEMRLAPELPRIRADQSQVEQVVMNLAINARDAMPHGGTLLLETAALEVPEGAPDAEAPPGSWVRLSISDTGTGIPPEVRAHLFEPFFTTKGVGQGSGLGLSTVYGIVTQSGGHIAVDTEVGRGTSFRIYLPATTDRPSERRRPAAGEARLRETGTVLLVEDDMSVRMISAQLLRRIGLEVIEAGDGQEALAAGARREQRIDLLVTDVVMPGANGIETAARLRELRPGLPVLYVSGYSPLLFSSHPSLEPGAPYLQKPYSSRDLIAAVQDVLGAARK
jgi:signal transduction histidine kinase/ActR/RegA family two-component response regulator